MDRSWLCGFINKQRYGVVSSIAEDGSPQSALVGIACSAELAIIFDTLNSSRKYENLLRRPKCSLVVGWSGEQTLQIEGTVEVPAVYNLKPFQDVYFAHWPDGRERSKWPSIAYCVIRPEWLRYSDFDQSPPLIQEMTRSDLV